MRARFFYGHRQTYADVTDEVLRFCRDGPRIHIPADDLLRALIFGDPLPGVVKDIVAITEQGGAPACRVYPDDTPVDLDLPDGDEHPRPPVPVVPSGLTIDQTIAGIHEQLAFVGGSLEHEWPEQAMVARFLNPAARVLELGANVGRNTMMIASLLTDSANLVTLECDPRAAELLSCNRNANGFSFHIEASALSYRPLMQEGWTTVPGDELLPGHAWVATVTFEQLLERYGLAFDTLVADCEGALFYILSDSPGMLAGIGTVILEADYPSLEHKRAVEVVFAEHGLVKAYAEPLAIDWDHNFPDEVVASFFEVWTRP